MFKRCITQPVLGQSALPANQGIPPYTFVPSYVMNVGYGTYQTGYRSFYNFMQVEKPIYASKDVPFQKLAIEYQP